MSQVDDARVVASGDVREVSRDDVRVAFPSLDRQLDFERNARFIVRRRDGIRPVFAGGLLLRRGAVGELPAMLTGFCQQDVRAMQRFAVRDRGKTHATFLVRLRDELLVEEFRRGGLA